MQCLGNLWNQLETGKTYNYTATILDCKNSPNFKSETIFSDYLVAIRKNKSFVLSNKPICIGQAGLDLSKLLMYDFYYNNIKGRFGSD